MKHIVLALIVVASIVAGGRPVLASGHEAATPLEAVETLIKPFYTPGNIPDTCNALTGQVRACPVTERLRNRIEQSNQSGETGNLVSRSQNPPQGLSFMVVEETQERVLLNVRWTYGSQGELSYTITFVVQGQGSKWLVDDAYCAGQPESSVHNPSVGPCSPSPQVAILLRATVGSTVSGNALLMAEGAGTRVRLDVAGLAPGTGATATLHAGTCAMPGASAALLPALTANESGTATATGLILFRGTESVALTDIADGDHLVAIAGPSGIVACGQIPPLKAAGPGTLPSTGEAPVPAALPNTGGGSGSLALVATALVCFVLGMSLRLRRRIA